MTAQTPATELTDARVVSEIGDPFPMYGFQGCTDMDPDACACATDTEVECSACGEVIEPGTPTNARQEGQPWLDPDDPEQDWITLWWHASCDTRTSRAKPAPSGDELAACGRRHPGPCTHIGDHTGYQSECLQPISPAPSSAEAALAEAVVDLCWRATQYGETEGGDTYAYIVTKGSIHRLIGAAQGAGISASFRADTTIPIEPEDDLRSRFEALASEYERDGRTPVLPTHFTHLVVAKRIRAALAPSAEPDEAVHGICQHSFVWRVPGDNLNPPARRAHLSPCVRCGESPWQASAGPDTTEGGGDDA